MPNVSFAFHSELIYSTENDPPHNKAAEFIRVFVTLRTMAVTHFEPSSAREAFPCFDEPSMKAVFSLNIVRKRKLTSLSNMPLVRHWANVTPLRCQDGLLIHCVPPQLSTTVDPDGLAVDHYQTSVRMSTYLVAFVVSDYVSNSATTRRGVKVCPSKSNYYFC